MKGTYKALRKTIVFIVGVIVIIVGVILLAIPGPGLVTIAVGLVILSSEFEWAERYLTRVKQKIRSAYDETKKRQQEFKDKHRKK